MARQRKQNRGVFDPAEEKERRGQRGKSLFYWFLSSGLPTRRGCVLARAKAPRGGTRCVYDAENPDNQRGIIAFQMDSDYTLFLCPDQVSPAWRPFLLISVFFARATSARGRRHVTAFFSAV